MKREIKVEEIGTSEDRVWVRTRVWYDLGGTDMLVGASFARGYWLGAVPVKISGQGMMTVEAFSGSRTFLEEASRFSQKRLEELAAQAINHPKYPQLLAQCCIKGDFSLVRHFVVVPQYDHDKIHSLCATTREDIFDAYCMDDYEELFRGESMKSVEDYAALRWIPRPVAVI